MSLGGGLDYFIDTVFNYPTLAECYKTAALDAANDLRRSGQYDSIDMFVPVPPVPDSRVTTPPTEPGAITRATPARRLSPEKRV